MHKRLVGIVATVAVIAAACGGATTSTAPSTAPAASVAPGASAAAPSAAASQGANLAPDQTLRLYFGATDPRSLRPQAASGSDEISVLSAIHRGLLYYDKDLKLVPSLAEALPTVSADGLTYTFKLRDAKYADGTPIVAGDIVRSFRSLADPRNAFDYGYEMCLVAGAVDVMGVDFCGTGPATPTDPAVIDDLLTKIGATAPDDKTFEVKLAAPTSFFDQIMAMWLTVPTQEKWTKYADAADLGASGPFMVESWTHNEEFVLVQNPNWYGVKPTLTKIVLKIGGDPEAAVASYERGDLDIVPVPGTSAQRVVDDATLKPQVIDTPVASVTYYDFATCQNPVKCPPSTATADGKTPLANKNFRIAMTRAIDKKEMLKVVSAGVGTVASSSVMPGIPGWPDDYDPYPFDVAAANAAMATALTELGVKDTTGTADGKPDGKVTVRDVGKLKFGYNCDAGHTPRVTYMAGAWRTNLGFSESQFDISCTDFAVFRTERRAGKTYDITRNGWGADFPHPDNQLRDLFATGSGNNNSGYQNPAFDALLGQGASATDPAKAQEFYKTAQRMLVDDAPVIWLKWDTDRDMVKPYVKGVTSTATNHQNIGDVFYETIQIEAH